MSLPSDIEGVRVLAEKLAREHAAAGGKVVGYVTPCVPAELIEAAGMRPIMLSAGTETSTTLGDRVMEDLFDTSVRGIFERLLKGEFGYLSAIVLPRANDSAHRLYYYLSELKRTGEAKLPPVLLCDVVMTPDEASRRYSIDALGRLWEELKAISGCYGGEQETRVAITLANKCKSALVSMVQTPRRQAPLPGALALAAFAAPHMLSPIAEALLLSGFGLPRTKLPESRVIICGSTQYDAGLHELIEDAGGAVVGDYHAGGELSVGSEIGLFVPAPRRFSETPVLELLVDLYRADLAASRRCVDAGAHIAQFASDCGANLAIFSYFPEEEALTWDYPEQKAALEGAGVRVLRLPEQTRPFDIAGNRAAVEEFLRGAGK